MAARIAIDPNIRVRGNQTYAGLEDVEGPIVVGGRVEVYERESGLTGPGEVVEVDRERRLVYLTVEWAKLRERPMPKRYGIMALDDLWAALLALVNKIRQIGQSARPPRHAGRA